MSTEPLRWDIFCRVIDNHGDIGVCWRLIRHLTGRGHTCRLWVDDASALAWMAPGHTADGISRQGVEIHPWEAAVESPPMPGDVVVEAFGCDIPSNFIVQMQGPRPPIWLNLEYFSAEAYVEKSHGLPSPVSVGPGAGLVKYFFFPGVSEHTGGLLQPWPHAAMPRCDTAGNLRADVMQRCHIGSLAAHPQDRYVSVFCYGDAPLEHCLPRLGLANDTCHVLLMAGPAQAWLHRPISLPDSIKLWAVPALPQGEYDQLLSVCDLNIVRGEDSAVSALWAGQPHIWHIYQQDDQAHMAKLQAFMHHWMKGWPDELRIPVQQLWQAFNAPDQDNMHMLPLLWQGETWSAWQHHSRMSQSLQSHQSGLIDRLLAFVERLRA